MTRHHGTLRPMENVGPELGWSVVADPDPSNPFTEIAFIPTHDLLRAGIANPASGIRVVYSLKRVGPGRSARAIDITKETTQ